jgi:hypothetical protein
MPGNIDPIASSPDFWLTPADFFSVQSIHLRQFVGGFNWMCGLNSKYPGALAKSG